MKPMTTVTQLEFCEARTGLYAAGTRQVLSRALPLLTLRKGDMLDVGCRTGISTLELLKVTLPDVKVVGLEENKVLLNYVRRKFGLFGSAALTALAMLERGDYGTGSFLLRFAEEAKAFSKQVQFVTLTSDCTFCGFVPESSRFILGAQLLHRLASEEQGSMIKLFAAALKKDGILALSSSMSFYVPTKFKPGETTYLHHPFVQAYLRILAGMVERKSGKTVELTISPINLKRPDETLEFVKRFGFRVVGYYEAQLPPVDASFLFEYYLKVVPGQLGMFDNTPFELDDRAREAIIHKAMMQAIKQCLDTLPTGKILTDTEPIFLFRKK